MDDDPRGAHPPRPVATTRGEAMRLQHNAEVRERLHSTDPVLHRAEAAFAVLERFLAPPARAKGARARDSTPRAA